MGLYGCSGPICKQIKDDVLKIIWTYNLAFYHFSIRKSLLIKSREIGKFL